MSEETGDRLQYWVGSLLFTCICLTSHVTFQDGEFTPAQNWVTAGISINLILIFLGIIFHFVFRKRFDGKYFEVGLLTAIVLVWCATLPTVMNPRHNVAISGVAVTPIIINSNLYFFSWIAFAFSAYAWGNFLQELAITDIVKEIKPKNAKWVGLFGTSLVMMITSIEFQVDNCPSGPSDTCRRNAYAVSIGVLGIILTSVVLALYFFHRMRRMYESIVAFLMLTFYTIGVGVITFGRGPATYISNMYFAAWIGLGISVMLSLECWKEIRGKSDEEEDDVPEIPKKTKSGRKKEEADIENQNEEATVEEAMEVVPVAVPEESKAQEAKEEKQERRKSRSSRSEKKKEKEPEKKEEPKEKEPEKKEEPKQKEPEKKEEPKQKEPEKKEEPKQKEPEKKEEPKQKEPEKKSQPEPQEESMSDEAEVFEDVDVVGDEDDELVLDA